MQRKGKMVLKSSKQKAENNYFKACDFILKDITFANFLKMLHNKQEMKCWYLYA